MNKSVNVPFFLIEMSCNLIETLRVSSFVTPVDGISYEIG